MTRTLGMPIIPANSLIANFESYPAQPKVHTFSTIFPEQSSGRRKIAFLGDSITAQGFGGTLSTGYTFASVGYATWVAYLSRRRVDISPASNFGVSGQTTAQMLERIADVVAFNPEVCVVLAGTNDIGTLTPAQSIANLSAIYDALYAKRIKIIAVLIPPRGSITTAQYGKINQVNQWILSQRSVRKDFYTVDTTIAYGDQSTGVPKTSMSSDALHPLVYGAYAIGNEIANVINVIFPDPTIPFSNPLDVYSATDNPTGNLVTTGTMTGTSGTLSNGPTGSLATGWTANGVNMPAGSTSTFSKITKDDGRIFQKIVFGGTYNVANPSSFNVYPASVHGSCAAGDTIEAMCEFEADGDIQNLAGAQLLLDIATPSGNPVPFDMAANNTNLLPPVAFGGILKTPRVTLPATPTLVRATLRFTAKGVAGSSTLAGTVRFGSMSIRKVVY